MSQKSDRHIDVKASFVAELQASEAETFFLDLLARMQALSEESKDTNNLSCGEG